MQGKKITTEVAETSRGHFEIKETLDRVSRCLDAAVGHLNAADEILKADLNSVLFCEPFNNRADIFYDILQQQRRIQVFAELISLIEFESAYKQ